MDKRTELEKEETALHRYERSFCECNQCKAGCKSMPGMMSPQDVIEIGEHCGVVPNDDPLRFMEWVADHYAASEGAEVVMSNGTTSRIPTIVPQQDDDGHCVFLDENDRCTIHPVAPFGCRQFKICDGDDQELDNEKSRSVLNVISKHDPYHTLHSFLKGAGSIAPPLLERKRKLGILLKEQSKEED